MDCAVVSSSVDPDAIRSDQLADRSVEAVGERDQRLALLALARCFVASLLGFERARGQRGLAQHFQRLGHAADLVAAIGFLDRLVERAVGDVLHPAFLAVERAENVAGDQPGQQRHQRRARRRRRAEPHQQRVHVGVEVVDIEAVAHGDVPRREVAGIDHLADRLGLAGAGIEIIGRCAALRALPGRRRSGRRRSRRRWNPWRR